MHQVDMAVVDLGAGIHTMVTAGKAGLVVGLVQVGTLEVNPLVDLARNAS